jgi:hypothetical protein
MPNFNQVVVDELVQKSQHILVATIRIDAELTRNGALKRGNSNRGLKLLPHKGTNIVYIVVGACPQIEQRLPTCQGAREDLRMCDNGTGSREIFHSF